MLKTNFHKRAVLLFGCTFFLVQSVLAIIFYRERLFADSSYFLFQPINNGWFSIEHKRFLLAACQVLPLIGSYLGFSLKTLLILYSLNHVVFFLSLFLFLAMGLNDTYGGMAIIAILLFNSLRLYVMPYLETWYATGLAVILFSILKQNKKSLGFIALAALLEITIIFSHPENFILVIMLLLLFIPHKREEWSALNIRSTVFILTVVLLASAIYKFTTLDAYENSHIGWALSPGNTSVPVLKMILDSILQLSKALIGDFKIPLMLLSLSLASYIITGQLKRAAIVVLAFTSCVVLINFLFAEKTVTMYSSIHYIPVVAITVISFFYDALPSYSNKIRNITLFTLFGIIVFRSLEQVHAMKQFTCSVEMTEKLITNCDKTGGNKFFVKVPGFISPYVDWTYPVQTLLLSAERGRDKCRTIASDEDTMVIPAAKKIFSDSSFLMLTRFNFKKNTDLNPNYFYCATGTYKTIDYTTCLERAYSSHIYLPQPNKEWGLKPVELFNGFFAIHFKGDEYGLGIKIPHDSLDGEVGEYYAKVTLSRIEPKANGAANALLVCDITDQNIHKFYASAKIDKEQVTQDSNSRTYSYEFELPAENINHYQLSFYIWNLKQEYFYITAASVELFKVPTILFKR
jgi:hypothetical protein